MGNVYDKLESFSDTFPILLYMVHLALGENGAIHQKDENDLNSNTRTKNSWTFADVYRETKSVLKGLCEKCRLVGLSNSFGDQNIAIDQYPPNESSLDELTGTGSVTSDYLIGNDTDPIETLPNLSTDDGNESIKTSKSSSTKSVDRTCDEHLNCITNDAEQDIADGVSSDNGGEKIEDPEKGPTSFNVVCSKTEENLQSIKSEDKQPDVLDSSLKDVPLMANINEVIVEHYVLNLDVSFDDKCISGTEILFLRPANAEVGKNEFQMCLDCTLIDIVSVEEVVLPENFELHFHQDQCCCNRQNLNQDLDFEPKHELSGHHLKSLGIAEDGNKKIFSLHDEVLVDRQTAKNPINQNYQTEVEPIEQDSQTTDLSSQTPHNNFFCPSCRILHGNNEETNYRTKSLNYRTLPYAVYGWCIRVWNVESSRHHWPRCVVIKYKTKEIGPSLTWCKDKDGKYEF